MHPITIGIIGGSGLYKMKDLSDVEEIKVETPFGPPSDNFIVGTLAKKRVAFLPRHGRGHRMLPSEINYRANVYGFKKLGVRQVISISAVGSLKEEHQPLDIILPDQFIDRTFRRTATFFGDGVVGHIAFGDPLCRALTGFVAEGAANAEIPVKNRGTYLCMEGPAFSTRAESNLYRAWGLDIIGMTNATEAKLFREAEICYMTMALVTDYDCWHHAEAPVTVEMIIENLNRNNENAQRILKETVKILPDDRECACHHALQDAIITQPDSIPQSTREKLALIIGHYMSDKSKAD
jgi:5'-methylthioadenosine phosphorylase